MLKTKIKRAQLNKKQTEAVIDDYKDSGARKTNRNPPARSRKKQ